MNTIAEMARQVLNLAQERGALTFGDYVLSSGLDSNYYFDGRKLTLDPKGAHLMGRVFFEMLKAYDVEAIGGPALGADPIVTAVALTSHPEEKPLSGFIVRKEAKGHGTGQLIEGPLEPGSRVAIVDDTCSTGDSLFHAIEAAEAEGCEVEVVLVVLDRGQGGSEEFRRQGRTFHCLLEATPDGKIEPSRDLGLKNFWKPHPANHDVVWASNNDESGSSSISANWKEMVDGEGVTNMKNGRR